MSKRSIDGLMKREMQVLAEPRGTWIGLRKSDWGGWQECGGYVPRATSSAAAARAAARLLNAHRVSWREDEDLEGVTARIVRSSNGKLISRTYDD